MVLQCKVSLDTVLDTQSTVEADVAEEAASLDFPFPALFISLTLPLLIPDVNVSHLPTQSQIRSLTGSSNAGGLPCSVKRYIYNHIYTSIWRSMSNNEQVFVWRWKLSPSRGNRNWMKARKI